MRRRPLAPLVLHVCQSTRMASLRRLTAERITSKSAQPLACNLLALLQSRHADAIPALPGREVIRAADSAAPTCSLLQLTALDFSNSILDKDYESDSDDMTTGNDSDQDYSMAGRTGVARLLVQLGQLQHLDMSNTTRFQMHGRVTDYSSDFTGSDSCVLGVADVLHQMTALTSLDISGAACRAEVVWKLMDKAWAVEQASGGAQGLRRFACALVSLSRCPDRIERIARALARLQVWPLT